MTDILRGLTITNTGSSPAPDGGVYPSAVRVYLWGSLLAQVFPKAYQPLKYVRSHPKSRYTQSLIGQLLAQGISEEAIAALLALPETEAA